MSEEMPETEKKPLTLHQKLLEIQKAADFAKASDHGKKGVGYKYASVSQILGMIRPAMDEQGVLLQTSVVDTTFHPNFSETKAGAA